MPPEEEANRESEQKSSVVGGCDRRRGAGVRRVVRAGGAADEPAGHLVGARAGQVDQSGKQTFAAGGGNYEGGKWIEITSGRPIKRGRDVFGSGANYGKEHADRRADLARRRGRRRRSSRPKRR